VENPIGQKDRHKGEYRGRRRKTLWMLWQIGL